MTSLSSAAPSGGIDSALPRLLATALAYAAVGWLALALADPPGYASPLFPSAGIALAATITWGRVILPGVWLGSFAINLGLALLHGPGGVTPWLTAAVIATGAALQAALGASLLRRHVGTPLTLQSPGDILRAGLLGAVVACTVSASVATPALIAGGSLMPNGWVANWLTWWAGDTLGVLVGAPLVLTLIGHPRGDWKPRRLTVGLPLLLTLAVLATALAQLGRLDDARRRGSFEREADRVAQEMQARLREPLYALQALHSTALVRGDLDQRALADASQWWLQHSDTLQALGYAVRTTRAGVPALEAEARAEGLAGYTVFDRGGAPGFDSLADVVALRRVEPMGENATALGVNILSVPAAREALLSTWRDGQPAASAAFGLTQSSRDETGFVIYQALYQGRPADATARRHSLRGAVFVTVRTEALLDDVARPTDPANSFGGPLQWCLVDPEPDASRHRVAGPPGCDAAVRTAAAAAAAGLAQAPSMRNPWAARAAMQGRLTTARPLNVAGRLLVMHVDAPSPEGAGAQEALWPWSMAGLAAAALLGALLLTITGHSRRTEVAVQAATGELRREIAVREHAQQALHDSQARLRTILDHVPIGVLFMSPDGTLLESNPALANLLGLAPAVLLGRSSTDFIHPADLPGFRELRLRLLKNPGSTERRQVRLLRSDGREVGAVVTVAGLREPGSDRVLRLVGVVEDITDHLRLQESERARAQAEAASRAKSEFVSRMSHELRTPLNAMLGFAQLLGLESKPALGSQQHEWAGQIQRAGWHLLAMINETLDLARIESGAAGLTLEPLALAGPVAACQALVAAAAAQRQITISVDVPAEVPPVLADATRLKQVLSNLLSNAVKYNRDRGSVTVTAREEGPDTVELTVEDNGLGMNPAQLQALFQPYNRLGRENSGIEGTGIGLVISRRLTELMGGTLDVRSREGQGSAFVLRLPRARGEVALPVEVAAQAAPAGSTHRVHYVEDNETNVEVMRGILAQRPSIELTVSTNGLDALGALRSKPPDLVLLDMQLPDISGLELLRHLKQDEALADTPVIVVSADATTQRIAQALTLGATQYVTKPVEVARFLAIVDATLDGGDAHRTR